MTGRRLLLQTPDEVPLVFTVAPASSRLLAYLLDLTVFVALSALCGAIVLWLADDLAPHELFALVTIPIFNIYFIGSELRWQGRTLGKRVLGIRVVARDGGPLTSDLIFARNLTRMFETFLPTFALLEPQLIGLQSSGWIVIGWLWLGIIHLLPLLNRYQARVGDLVAGTIVVESPTEALLQDLVATSDGPTVARPGVAVRPPRYAFTKEQLDTYGIHELQILEDVLRRYPKSVEDELLVTIADRIQSKLKWQPAEGQDVDTHAFLMAFYAAQRARLEQDLLFGKRRERKRR